MLTVTDIDDNAASLSSDEMKEIKNMIHQSFIKAAEAQNLQNSTPLESEKEVQPMIDSTTELLKPSKDKAE